MDDIFIRIIHFIGILGLTSTLVASHMMLAPTMDKVSFKRLVKLDGFYGMFAGLTFIGGLTLWLWVGKPADFYSANWLFHVKLTLFVLAALLSIYPTVFYQKNRKMAQDSMQIPRIIFMLVRIQMVLILCLPILAVLMAKGIGLNSAA